MFPSRRSRLRQLAENRTDVFVTVVVTVVTVGSLVLNALRDDRPIILLLVPAALAAIVLRRGKPGIALAIAVAVAAVAPSNQALVLPVMAVLYAIAVRTPWRTAAAAGAAAAAAAIVAGVASGSSALGDHRGLLGYAIGTAGSYAAAVAVGLYVAAQRRVLDGLRERAERLDRERQLLADRAVAHERVRIAQELHDIVAHNVSLMVVKAQALGATFDDDRVSESTDSIADLGRQAMTEMHTTLRLLRSDEDTDPELSPQPGLAELERLIEQSRGAGIDIELTIEGRPRQLAQGIDLSAFRIIQEALTNVIKHAAGASARVTLAYQAKEMRLTITDTEGESRSTPRPEPSDGHGVIGMRERATVFGGTLTTETLPDGFKVTATLPYGPVAS